MRLAFKRLISDEEELEQFARWAFGSKFRELEMGTQFMDAWNSTHGEELKLSSSGLISEDSVKMVELWQKSKGY